MSEIGGIARKAFFRVFSGFLSCGIEFLGGYRSGQTGQTVNLLAMPSQVRILHPPLLQVDFSIGEFEIAEREEMGEMGGLLLFRSWKWLIWCQLGKMSAEIWVFLLTCHWGFRLSC